jgi:L-ribulose-5-phosphate 3-epimerase
MKLGIMQGRLVPPEAGRFQSFPRSRWRDEFSFAAAAGLDTIEWIYDAYGEDVNPIVTDEGVREIERLNVMHRVAVESVCADWFMDFPLVGVDAQTASVRWAHLAWLLNRCGAMKIKRVVLPFVDASALRGAEDVSAVAAGIASLFEVVDHANIELHLETALSPADFAELLSRIPNARVKVNYDAGNSASLGYRPQDEFSAYGNRVGSVHLKDRKLGAGTVPLGTGDTDFEALFASLRSVKYRGDFILQVARGAEGEELAWARQNTGVARQMLRSLDAHDPQMGHGQI